MELLEALLTLSSYKGGREIQRPHLYAAVLRVVTALTDVLRIGDSVRVAGKIYLLQKAEKQDGGTAYVITVDNGRGPAILGDRVRVNPFIPHASYAEHVAFATQTGKIIDAFGDLLKTEVALVDRAILTAIDEGQHVERII